MVPFILWEMEFAKLVFKLNGFFEELENGLLRMIPGRPQVYAFF